MSNGPGNAPVEPHAAQLTAWNVPSAVVAGERFKFTVGVRCSAGCDLGGREFSLCDQPGRAVLSVQLGSDVWPGTEAV
jgi:hypothetical protein